MRSININELRRGIPRYSNTINEPKPKWTRRKTYQRIPAEIQALKPKPRQDALESLSAHGFLRIM
jgi:hypothetical protein